NLPDFHKMVAAVLLSDGLAAFGADALVELGAIPLLHGGAAAGAGLAGALRVGGEAAALVLVATAPMRRRAAHRSLGPGRGAGGPSCRLLRHCIYLPWFWTAPGET